MRNLLRGALLAALLGVPLSALADEPPKAAPAAADPSIEMPRALGPLTAEYPSGEKGEHDVTLELRIGADGAVQEARAIEGDPPFTDAATTAAQTFRFEPAKRNGKPVAARIRVQVHFTPPVEVVEEPAEEPAPAKPTPGAKPGKNAPAPPPEPPKPIEVRVQGDRRPVGTVSLGRAEVRLMPGAFGDPFRAIEALPGVTPIASGLPYFYIRGAPPGNVGYFIDGIRVPVLYHLGVGFSVVNPGLVDRVDLYPGGYPAKFGRYAGGIVSGETRAPAGELRGEATLRMVDVGGLVEAPLLDGRASVLVGGRYSYTGLLLSLIQPNVKLDYWDYQGRFTYDITPRQRITVFAFGSYDSLRGRNEEKDPFTTLFSTEFHRLDLRYDASLDERTQLRQAVMVGFDRTALTDNIYARDLVFNARTQITHRASEALLVRAGVDATMDSYDTEFRSNDGEDRPRPQLDRLFPPRQDIVVGAYADAVIDAGRGIELVPGARVDLWGSRGNTAFSADFRLAARVPVTSKVRLNNAIGLVHQAPGFVLPVPGFAIGSLAGGLQKAFQTSAGVEADLPWKFTGSATAYFNGFFNMSDALGTAQTSNFGGGGGRGGGDGGNGGGGGGFDVNARSLGSSFGLELMLKRQLTEKLGGFLSYTLSRSTRTVDRKTFPARFDRTHVLNAAVSYEMGRGWRAGGRVVFYTGTPINLDDPRLLSLVGRDRLKPFFRLDVRIEKRWRIKRGWLSLVIEAQNATLSKEEFNVGCDEYGCKSTWIGPVTIPSIGLEGGF
jgi:TonB family protein